MGFHRKASPVAFCSLSSGCLNEHFTVCNCAKYNSLAAQQVIVLPFTRDRRDVSYISEGETSVNIYTTRFVELAEFSYKY